VTDDARCAYDAWHAGFDVDAGAEAPWHRMVLAHLRPLDGARMLEIGCGRGGFAAKLAETTAAARVCGVDFSRTAVAMAARHGRAGGHPQLAFAVGDILTIPYRDGAFDAVVSCETVEHVADPARAVRELARVLRPGGMLYLTTPNYLGIMGLYRGYRRLTGRPYTEVGQPINRLTLLPRTVHWIRAAGLTVRAVDGHGHYLPAPGRPPVELALPTAAQRLLRAFALHSLVVAEKV